jgi:hypothetical protein
MSQTNQKVVDAVNTILRELNGGNKNEIVASIFETLSVEHRTIQQLFWGVMLKVQISYYANIPFDQRNEASVKLAKLVREVAIKNNLDTGLPYV